VCSKIISHRRTKQTPIQKKWLPGSNQESLCISSRVFFQSEDEVMASIRTQRNEGLRQVHILLKKSAPQRLSPGRFVWVSQAGQPFQNFGPPADDLDRQPTPAHTLSKACGRRVNSNQLYRLQGVFPGRFVQRPTSSVHCAFS
jgi:hypothetical protein